jgi:tetratricopeptide (TPR) repeat protein
MLLLLTGIVHATTWKPSEKTDPLTGEKVPAWEIMSYGSYIYKWPSKYDLVFWPLTDEGYICFNPKNGYGAFNGDFEKISGEEKKTLTKWLSENYKPSEAPKSHKEKLAWLEKVYSQRKMDNDFWCRFYRLMAYVHRGDHNKSVEYVKKAIPLLNAKLQTNPEGIAKIEVLFLLGEYHRRTGELEKAKEYFAQVKKAKYKDDNGKEQTGHPYYVGLVQDREQLLEEESSNKADSGDGK